MRHMLIALTLLALTIAPAIAQTNEVETWEIIERCVGEPVEPPVDWSFEGIIFLESHVGIHGLNSMIETPYILAYNSDESFGRSGAISPDGRWFAAPLGHTSYGNSIDDWFSVDYIKVVQTDGLGDVYQLDWDWAKMGSSSWIVPRLEWVSETEIIYETANYSNAVYIINPFTGEQRLEDEAYDFNEPPIGLYALSDLVLRSDRTGYIARVDEMMRFYDANGLLINMIYNDRVYIVHWENDDTQFAFTTFDEKLLLAKMETQQIVDICLDANGFAWSPNGELAVSDGERISIINFEDNTHYIAAYHEGSVFDWRVPPEEN